MDFIKYISTPAGQTEAAPLITKLPLADGKLVGGWLYFPEGPAGTLHFLARKGSTQILPYNTGQNYRLNDIVIPFFLDIPWNEPPFIIDLVTWNDSISYAHVLTVCFFIQHNPPAS